MTAGLSWNGRAVLGGRSRRIIDSRHAALSVRNTTAPNRGLFQSIVALTYGNALAPDGASILVAVPDGANRCAGTTTQVYPSALSCGAIQADLIRSGRTVAGLLELPLIATSDGTEALQTPTAAGGGGIVTTTVD